MDPSPPPPPPPADADVSSPIRARSDNVNSGGSPPGKHGAAEKNGSSALSTPNTELQLADTFGTSASQATSLSRETTDIQGNRVRETTTVSTMPDGTTIRTTETMPRDPNATNVTLTTVHERTEPSGRTTRITLTTEPDGTNVKQTETIRPGGSKTVTIETTDPGGRRNVETADYPPTLVTPPTNYGLGSGMTVVSEITYPQTYAPWMSRPVDVDEMKEVGVGAYPPDGSGYPPSRPFWTKRKKLAILGAAVLLVVAGIAVVASIAATSSPPGGGGGSQADDLSGDSTNYADEDEDEDEYTFEPEILYPDLSPQSVGFDNEWDSEEGWVVAPSFAGTGESYYRPYLIAELGLCADRCSKTDAVGGAFFPRQDGSICYCFAAIGCVDPTVNFLERGTIFSGRSRPDNICAMSMCSYFPDDLLCEGFDAELPSTSAPSRSPVARPTEAPTAAPSSMEASPDVEVATGLVTDSPTSAPQAAAEGGCTVGPLVREGVPCADFRYVPWADLQATRKLLAEFKLDYTTATWNYPGTAAVESLSWEQLNKDQRVGAQSLGFESEASWDCYQNHYRGLSWETIESEGVQVYYSILGWTEASWYGLALPPVTEDLPWNLLSSEQRAAARELCYSQLVWDRVGL